MMPRPREIGIMEYVRSLENKVRKYQGEGVRIGWIMFCWGFLAGSVIVATVWVVMRLIRLKG